MLFLPDLAEAIKAGKKTQTRRLAESNDRLVKEYFQDRAGHWHKALTVVRGHRDSARRVLYRVGQTYAAQPGRGKSAIARIRLTAIRQEALQLITAAGVRAEGLRYGDGPNGTWMGWNDWYSGGHQGFAVSSWMTKDWRRSGDLVPKGARSVFAALWDTLHKRRPARWTDNPMVWVLTFKRVA
jgi:hypothetical protein